MTSHRALSTAALLLAASCADPVVFDTGDVLPDFALEDDNASSATHGQLVSPSHFLGQARAWYFGHSS